MNNFKKLSAIILVLCTSVTIFASCTNDNSQLSSDEPSTSYSEDTKTEIITNEEGKTSVLFITNKTDDKNSVSDNITETVKETVTVNVTDKKGEVSVSVSEKIVNIPVRTTVRTVLTTVNKQTPATLNNTAVSAAKTTKINNANPAVKPTVKTTVSTTKKPVINDTINEKSVGISMLTKTDPVQIGDHATIFVQGTPGKTYSIEFYETPSSAAKSDSLEDKKTDANGFVSWTFKIKNTCNLGKRKLIIKEKNSSNYLETSITVK